MNVSPTQLDVLRIAGERAVVPDADTKARIAASGTNLVVGSFRYCIDEQGEVSSLALLRTTGDSEYDDQLRAAIECWRFRPYEARGKAEPVCTAVTFVYRL